MTAEEKKQYKAAVESLASRGLISFAEPDPRAFLNHRNAIAEECRKKRLASKRKMTCQQLAAV